MAVEPAIQTKRPKILSLVCLLGFFSAPLVFVISFLPEVKALGISFQALIWVTLSIGVVCLIGLWEMKRWSVVCYTGLIVAQAATELAMGKIGIGSYIYPLVVMGVGWSNYKRMT